MTEPASVFAGFDSTPGHPDAEASWIAVATILLENERFPGDLIASIAQEFGFRDHAHFTRTFQKHFGVTPSAYRREYQHPS
jgi:AraC-like DNA-binding protein